MCIQSVAGAVHCLTPCPEDPIRAQGVRCLRGNVHECKSVTQGHHVPSASFLDGLVGNLTQAQNCVSWKNAEMLTMRTCRCKQSKDVNCAHFPEILSLPMIDKFVEMLRYFHQLTEKNKIDYTFVYGAALGLFRFNHFMPWDDDIDLYLKPSDESRVFNMITFPYCKHRMYPDLWKFFRCDSPHPKKNPWGYPFVDVWTNIGTAKHKTLQEKHLFPSEPITVYNITLNVPRDLKAHVNERYGSGAETNCQASPWIHESEQPSGFNRTLVSCANLMDQCFKMYSSRLHRDTHTPH